MNILKPHVSLNVSNIDASVAFYERAFGVPPVKRRPGHGGSLRRAASSPNREPSTAHERPRGVSLPG